MCFFNEFRFVFIFNLYSCVILKKVIIVKIIMVYFLVKKI